MEAVVKFWNEERGYGFLEVDVGHDVFCHVSALQGIKKLEKGDRVTFEVEKTDRGEQARNVQLVK